MPKTKSNDSVLKIEYRRSSEAKPLSSYNKKACWGFAQHAFECTDFAVLPYDACEHPQRAMSFVVIVIIVVVVRVPIVISWVTFTRYNFDYSEHTVRTGSRQAKF